MPRPIRRWIVAVACLSPCFPAYAGGPRWTAGTVFFSSSARGKAVVWPSGSVNYYLDQGALSGYVSNSAAAQLVAAAAQPWTQVSTANVSITNAGSLAEDVSGATVSGSGSTVVLPADVESTAKPVAVIFDADGSVLNAILGGNASDPSDCMNNVVYSWVDQFTTAGGIAHAGILLNGLCATNAQQVTNMQYLLMREWGRVLGLGWSQANDNIITGSPAPVASDFVGWPLMHPVNINCGGDNYSCLGGTALTLRMDDRATLGRLYPGTTLHTATIRLSGSITFANGQGMQGVNVVATRLWNGTTTTDTTMVASVTTGVQFRGDAGNVVSGTTDVSGNSLLRFGSATVSTEGAFDLTGLEVPAGTKSADYMLTFEPVNSLYTGNQSVGPESPGTPLPSGTLAPIILRNLYPGQVVTENIVVSDSASGSGITVTQGAPAVVPASGTWGGVVAGYGNTPWWEFAVRPNRTFAVIAQALDENGSPSWRKLMPVIGVWMADDPAGGAPEYGSVEAFNCSITGTTVLEGTSPPPVGSGLSVLTTAIADERGDGRPDYGYKARLLYADSVSPAALPTSGGQAVIVGSGFQSGDKVYVGGVASTVLLSSSTALLISVPAGASGVADVEIDEPGTNAYAIISGGISYGGGGGAVAVATVAAPSGNAAVGATAPQPFIVQALDASLNPVPGASITFAVTGSGATLSACGATSCTVAASGSGIAETYIAPTAAGNIQVQASLASGATTAATLTATSSSSVSLAPLTLPLYSFGGAAANWNATVLATQSGAPKSGVSIKFTNKLTSATSTTTTGSDGTATYAISSAAFSNSSSATVQACIISTTTCISFPMTAETPAIPNMIAMSGTTQTVRAGQAFAPIALRMQDEAANTLSGVPLTISQYVYSYNAFNAAKSAPARVLASSMANVTSAADGSVTITPLQVANVSARTVVQVQFGPVTLGLFTLTAAP